jgi:MFS family permease
MNTYFYDQNRPDSGMNQYRSIFSVTFVVAALGYFVDVYDLVLFGVVRISSLKSLGIVNDELMNVGVHLINYQMVGILLGGIFWGIVGDKRGRISVLLGSIFLYSVANILNAFVTEVGQYAILRFIAGVGLAGEVGAAITLVSEILTSETRGIGTAILTSFGILGAVASGGVSGLMSWQAAYLSQASTNH